MIADHYSVIESFKALPRDAIALDFLREFAADRQPLFVCPVTGILSSERKMSAHDIVDYWSRNIFRSNDPNDYSAINPFAQGRLLYTLLTLADFVIREGNIPGPPHLCDFATGQGVLLDLARQHVPDWRLSATEESRELAQAISAKGHRVVATGLGFGAISLARELGGEPNVATLCWTLCNCIDPLAVLSQIHATMADGGYLCVAEGSRIMVPYRKSLRDILSPVHPPDAHPFYFSRNSLAALLTVAGFRLVYVNRYFDSDVLLVIARKQTPSRADEKIVVDDPVDVATFMKNWFEATRYFEADLRHLDRSQTG
ncbi:MAG TPA: methyltransferase domain-containing protein [Candidatus Acidoferrales bacterium]|nr:methyltransferase domain-containing protein [Candidatus Acidoferrales bacterium]